MEIDDKKKTALDDDAFLYQKRERKSTWNQFKELHGREKWAYFKRYMLMPIVVVIAAIVIVVLTVRTAVINSRYYNILYAAVCDVYISDTNVTRMTDELGVVFGKDSEYQEVFLDTTYMLSSSTDYASAQKLQAMIAAKDIDIIILTKPDWERYAASGFFLELPDVLPEDLLETVDPLLAVAEFYTDDDGSFVEIEGDPSVVPDITLNTSISGIRLDSIPLFAGQYYEEPPMLGIVVNTQNLDNTIDFLRYILTYEPVVE